MRLVTYTVTHLVIFVFDSLSFHDVEPAFVFGLVGSTAPGSLAGLRRGWLRLALTLSGASSLPCNGRPNGHLARTCSTSGASVRPSLSRSAAAHATMTPLSVQRRGGGTTMRHGAPSSRGEGVLAQSSPSLCGGDGGESTRQAVRRSGRPRRQRCIRAALYSRRRSRRGGGVCHPRVRLPAQAARLCVPHLGPPDRRRSSALAATPPERTSVSGAQPSESRSSARRRKAYLRGRVSDTSRTRVVDMSGEEADGARQPHLEVAQRRVLKGGRHAGAEGGRGALLLARPLDGESHRRLEPAVIRQPQGGKSVLCGVFRAPRE